MALVISRSRRPERKTRSRRAPVVTVRPASIPAPRRTRRRSRGNRGGSALRLAGMIQTNPGQNTFATSLTNTFSVSPSAQRVAEASSEGAVRVSGSTLGPRLIQYFPTDASNRYFGVMYNSETKTVGHASQPLYMRYFGNRLVRYMQMYQYYAIRKLRIAYVPALSAGATLDTTTYGNFHTGTNLLAVGIIPTGAPVQPFRPDVAADSQNPELASNVSSLGPSFVTSVWMPQNMNYKHDGSRVYSCADVAGGPYEESQISLAAAVFNSATYGTLSTANVTLGYLWLDYVVDFYCPTISSQAAAHGITGSFPSEVAIESKLLSSPSFPSPLPSLQASSSLPSSTELKRSSPLPADPSVVSVSVDPVDELSLAFEKLSVKPEDGIAPMDTSS